MRKLHLIILFACCLLSMGLFSFLFWQQDTASFVNAVLLLTDDADASPDRLFRLSKPLVLLFPTILYSLGFSITSGFWIQQLIAWWVCAFLVYRILLFRNSTSTAFLGALALVLCQPMAVYGLAYLVDAVGWAWMLLVVMRSLSTTAYHHRSKCIELGLLLGVGIFIKESIVLAGVFIFFQILLQQASFIQKSKQYLWIGTSFILTLSLGSLLTYAWCGQTLYHWILFNNTNTPPSFQFLGFVLQSYRTLDVFWLFALLGFASSWSVIRKATTLQVFLLTALTSWVLTPICWPYYFDRILFMNAIFLLPFIVRGIRLFRGLGILLVLVGGLSNLFVTFAIYRYQTTGLLPIQLLVVACLLLCSYFYINRYYKN